MPEGAGGERRFKLVVKTDAAGMEHLSIEPLIDRGEAPGEDIPHHHLVDLASRIYDARRARTRYFHNTMLGEPVWDMLLALFCAPARWENLTLTGLSSLAGVPPTTAKRWVNFMEQKGLIERRPDPLDGRRIFVSLTQQGETSMRDCLSSMYRDVVGDRAATDNGPRR